MKISKEFELEIKHASTVAHDAFEWVWKHEDAAYREGTFESVCYALSCLIFKVNNKKPSILIEEIRNALKLDSRKLSPSSVVIYATVIAICNFPE